MTQEEKAAMASYIRANISQESRLEMLAEEASELAKAALKLARILRAENPTPISSEQATSDLLEEWSDVMLCGDMLGLQTYPAMIEMKIQRWKKRIESCKSDPKVALKYHFLKKPCHRSVMVETEKTPYHLSAQAAKSGRDILP